MPKNALPANATGLPKINRRLALFGTMVSSAALAIPAVAAARKPPIPMSAAERAAFHFAAMADALNELSADAHGWYLQCGDRSAGGVVKGWDRRWFSPTLLRMEVENSPRHKKPFYVDQSDRWEEMYFDADSSRAVTAPILPYVRKVF